MNIHKKIYKNKTKQKPQSHYVQKFQKPKKVIIQGGEGKDKRDITGTLCVWEYI